MGKEEVLKEIDLRMKRLEAQVELLEEQLERESSRRVPTSADKFSLYYLLFMGLWFIIGLLVLLYLHSRVAPGVELSLWLYALIGAVTVGLPLAYLLWPRRPEEIGIEERLAAAKVALKAFYKPLREAVEKNDPGALISLADRLLNDPGLSAAVELANEGDPKVIAYALYLYANYSDELEDDAKETLNLLTNRPVKLLLSSLLRE